MFDNGKMCQCAKTVLTISKVDAAGDLQGIFADMVEKAFQGFVVAWHCISM